MMNNFFNYIKHNWFLFSLAAFFLGWFVYLTYSGNKFCYCAKTETYKDGTTRVRSSGTTYYRYYHK